MHANINWEIVFDCGLSPMRCAHTYTKHHYSGQILSILYNIACIQLHKPHLRVRPSSIHSYCYPASSVHISFIVLTLFWRDQFMFSHLSIFCLIFTYYLHFYFCCCFDVLHPLVTSF